MSMVKFQKADIVRKAVIFQRVAAFFILNIKYDTYTLQYAYMDEIEPLFEEQVDFDTFSKSDFRVVKVKNCEAVPKSKKLLRFTLDDGTENERTILSGVHAFYEPEELVGKTLLAIVNLPPAYKSILISAA